MSPRAKPAALALALLGLTLLSFFRFPGHTILQSDTQIYIPVLEHLWDRSTLAQDVMAIRPHVSFTLYDEAALALRWITRASFEHVLMAQQFAYRFIGIAGLYFLTSALGITPWKALLVASVLSLGAVVNGPAVLTIEYEPVPRGFALPFVIASLAGVAHARWRAAAICAAIAFAFHPPTAVVYCGLLLLLLAAHRSFAGIALLAIGPAILLLSIVLWDPSTEHQPLFGRIDPALEALQRMRASYNWVSIWFANWKNHYALLSLAVAAALWRVRDRISRPLLLMLGGLPLIGAISIPLSYLLLEKAKWVLTPQFQPARYVLFITLMASLLCTTAGVIAAERRRWIEGFMFFTIAFAIPMDPKITNVLAPSDPLSIQRLAVAAGLAGFATLVCGLKNSYATRAGAVAAGILPFLVIPVIGQVRNYPALHVRELDELVHWARQNTSNDALFQFADSGRDLQPGVFRARAKRALFVDWKAGGQANFHHQFSEIWWKRWQLVEKPQPLEAYAALGIDYVVFKANGKPTDAAPVYSNPRYVVYRLR
jgi:hypothetical protein